MRSRGMHRDHIQLHRHLPRHPEYGAYTPHLFLYSLDDPMPEHAKFGPIFAASSVETAWASHIDRPRRLLSACKHWSLTNCKDPVAERISTSV
jgi:hypothetical protein